MTEGYVYLLGPWDWRAKWVKIGRTTNHPRARLASMQTANALTLELYTYFEGGAQLEAALHRIFRPLHLRGEWFTLDGRLLDFVSLTYFGRYAERATSAFELRDALQNALFVSDPVYRLDTTEEWDLWRNSADLAEVPDQFVPRTDKEVAKLQ